MTEWWEENLSAILVCITCSQRETGSETLDSYIHKIIEWFWSQGTFKDHVVPTPLPWAGISSARSRCSKTYPKSP